MSLEDDLAELQLDRQDQQCSPRTIKRPPNPIAWTLTTESPPSNPWFHTSDNALVPPHPESLAKRQRLLEEAMTPNRRVTPSIRPQPAAPGV